MCIRDRRVGSLETVEGRLASGDDVVFPCCRAPPDGAFLVALLLPERQRQPGAAVRPLAGDQAGHRPRSAHGVLSGRRPRAGPLALRVR
eukprot:7271491-Pyramimonas_sp.AAC.1